MSKVLSHDNIEIQLLCTETWHVLREPSIIGAACFGPWPDSTSARAEPTDESEWLDLKMLWIPETKLLATLQMIEMFQRTD